MSTTQPPLKLFISSPNEMKPAQDIVIDEIQKLAVGLEVGGRPSIAVTRWPEGIAGGVDDHSQGVINRQTDDCDIFICIVGTRLGTLTPTGGFPTEQEFEHVIMRIRDGENVYPVLFIDNSPVKPQDIDPHELLSVRSFIARAKSWGVLYHEFDSLNDLRNQALRDLKRAYQWVLEAKEQRTKRSVGKAKMAASNVVSVAYPEKRLARRESPQGADWLLIPLADYRRTSIRLTGTLHTLSEYFRFGFKYFESREPIVSAGSVQTVGKNILVHIGKNLDRPEWFLTKYRDGYRRGANMYIENTTGVNTARFRIDISYQDPVRYYLNDKLLYEIYFHPEGLPIVALMAWGDEHDFTVDIYDLELQADVRTVP